ncbi:MAG: hypothetical protein LBJ61_02445 [Deltaproteobacteria bacterium]|nr:hypothetical protein [Deltaproteobacteria bacterium]
MSFEAVYYGKTQGFEGGYVNDPSDSGGETFRGISRRSNPKWVGWAYVDEAKRKVGTKAAAINRYFKDDDEMASLVASLYQNLYWNPLNGIPELPDRVKMKLFDTAVNTGQNPAVQILQIALNRNGAKLSVDGKLGPLTRQAALSKDPDATLKAFSGAQADYYTGLVRKNPKNAKFLKGWLNRAAWLPC